MSVCRFCKEHGGSNLIHYATRHYAHAKCGFAAKGVAFLATLSDWQCHAQVPYRAAVEAGPEVEAELVRRSNKYTAENLRSCGCPKGTDYRVIDGRTVCHACNEVIEL